MLIKPNKPSNRNPIIIKLIALLILGSNYTFHNFYYTITKISFKVNRSTYKFYTNPKYIILVIN